MVRRTARVAAKVTVVQESMERNLALTEGKILAEPLYLLLAAHGHPDAHEKARTLSMAALERKRPLLDIAQEDAEFLEYQSRFTDTQRALLADPRNYVGRARERVLEVAYLWNSRLFPKT